MREGRKVGGSVVWDAWYVPMYLPSILAGDCLAMER